eukprot:jgi/Bigna1/89782/estExt_fgenesh1_pg.C_550083
MSTMEGEEMKGCEDTNTTSAMKQEEEEAISRSDPHILGIDEAGRGPVLGPLVYGICYCPKKMQELLKTLGFAEFRKPTNEWLLADSKVLSEEQREKLFALIKATKALGWKVDVISPEEISDVMLRPQKQSLNQLSHNSAMSLVRQALDEGVNVTEVFVDTVGPPDSYRAKLERNFPGIEFTVTSKADSKFPIVSAASICAKVVRDHALDGWTYIEEEKPNNDFGCGYPGDENTKRWLKENFDPVFGFPSLVRFSWSTARNIVEEKGHAVDWGNDQEQPSVTSYFSSKASSGPKLKDRFRYFQRKQAELVTTF